MKLTVDAVMALNPCDDYSRDSVEALLDRPLGTESQVVDLLLEIPENDARWFLSRALSVPNRVVWAEACAERARGYADAAGADAARYAADTAIAAEYAANAADAEYAEYAAEYAARAAKYAANAAEYAAEYAANAEYAEYSAIACAAEHRLAVEHAVRLMGAG